MGSPKVERYKILFFVFVFLFSLTFSMFFQIKVVKAQNTITIKQDGTIIPEDAPIFRLSTFEGVRKFIVETDLEIGTGIDIECSNSIIDGQGHRLTGNGEGSGIHVYNGQGITIMNFTIQGFEDGILLRRSGVCVIQYNHVINNLADGIILSENSGSNKVFENVIQGNQDDGIEIRDTSNQNTINSNIIKENLDDGIDLDFSNFNVITFNTFIDNANHVETFAGENNVWNGEYPTGGNFWSNNPFPQIDMFMGANQDQSGSDGIWDHPYIIDESYGIEDSYPLVNEPSLRSPTSISIDLSHKRINKGSELTVSGEISPAQSGQTVIIKYGYNGDTNKVVSRSDGTFEDVFVIPETFGGTTRIKVSWGGSITHLGAENSDTVEVNTNSGGSTDDGNWWEIIPGFPVESILLGIFVGLATIFISKQRKSPTSTFQNVFQFFYY